MSTHDIQTSVESFYGGKRVTVWCSNTGCYLAAEAEFNATERVEELAKTHDCPMQPSRCVRCGDPIAKGADVCDQCTLTPGYRVYDYDENKRKRN